MSYGLKHSKGVIWGIKGGKLTHFMPTCTQAPRIAKSTKTRALGEEITV